MKGRLFLITFLMVCFNVCYSQTSLIGGATINLLEDRPLNKIRYFGGVEFKIRLVGNLKAYTTPQYNGLRSENLHLRSVIVPLGLSYQFNRMWDERTTLFKVVDVNLGAYGGYTFAAVNMEEGTSIDISNPFSAGVRASAKMRLLIYYPLFISYNYGLSHLIFDDVVDNNFIQVGIYIPVSHFFKYY